MVGIFDNLLSMTSGGVLGSPAQQVAQQNVNQPVTSSSMFGNPSFITALNKFGQGLAQSGAQGQTFGAGFSQALGAVPEVLIAAQQQQQLQQQQEARRKLQDLLTLSQLQQSQLASQRAQAEIEAMPRELKLKEGKFNLEQRKFDLEADKFLKELEGGGVDQKQLFDMTTKLRGEFVKLSDDFIKQRDAFNRINASATDPSPAGDLALIFNYMKLLDPGSVVREGEFASAQNAGSIPERIRAQYNGIIAGEKLTSNQRNDFVKRAGSIYQSSNAQHRKRVGTYTDLAQKVGADPTQVVLDLGLAVKQNVNEQNTGIKFLGFE